MEIFISKSEKDTVEFAKEFAKNLKKGDIVVLSGELGSRKNKIYKWNTRIFWDKK